MIIIRYYECGQFKKELKQLIKEVGDYGRVNEKSKI